MTPQEDLDRDVRLEVYRFFVEAGRAPVPAEIGDALDVRPVDVEKALRRLHDAHVLVLAPGTPYLWMANPFSALPTPYLVRAGEHHFWGNCVWDACGILALLRRDGIVETRCGDCGEVLEVQVSGGSVNHENYLVHYAVPAAQWWDDIGFN